MIQRDFGPPPAHGQPQQFGNANGNERSPSKGGFGSMGMGAQFGANSNQQQHQHQSFLNAPQQQGPAGGGFAAYGGFEYGANGEPKSARSIMTTTSSMGGGFSSPFQPTQLSAAHMRASVGIPRLQLGSEASNHVTPQVRQQQQAFHQLAAGGAGAPAPAPSMAAFTDFTAPAAMTPPQRKSYLPAPQAPAGGFAAAFGNGGGVSARGSPSPSRAPTAVSTQAAYSPSGGVPSTGFGKGQAPSAFAGGAAAAAAQAAAAAAARTPPTANARGATPPKGTTPTSQSQSQAGTKDGKAAVTPSAGPAVAPAPAVIARHGGLAADNDGPVMSPRALSCQGGGADLSQLSVRDMHLFKYRALLRSILHQPPWQLASQRLKPAQIADQVACARRLCAQLSDADLDAVLVEVKAEHPSISAKYLFDCAIGVAGLDERDPYLAEPNWVSPDARQQFIQSMAETMTERANCHFESDVAAKETSFALWRAVRSGAAQMEPPPPDCLVMPGGRVGDSARLNPQAEHDEGAMNQTLSDDYFGGDLTSCFGNRLKVTLHALRWHGSEKAPPKEIEGSSVFCLNSRPQTAAVALESIGRRTTQPPPRIEIPGREFSLGGGSDGQTTARSATAAGGADPVDDIPTLGEPMASSREPGALDGGDICYYWDLGGETEVRDLGFKNINVDHATLDFDFTKSAACGGGCGIFGAKSLAHITVPLSSLYVDALPLNAVMRKSRFPRCGVHVTHRWYPCRSNPAYSLCLSLELECRDARHNEPVCCFDPERDPFFDATTGRARWDIDEQDLQNVWRLPLHRFLWEIATDANLTIGDLETDVLDGFRDYYVLDPELFLVIVLRSALMGDVTDGASRREMIKASIQLRKLFDRGLPATEMLRGALEFTQVEMLQQFREVPGDLANIFRECPNEAVGGIKLARDILAVFGVTDLEDIIRERARREVARMFDHTTITVSDPADAFMALCRSMADSTRPLIGGIRDAVQFMRAVSASAEAVQYAVHLRIATVAEALEPRLRVHLQSVQRYASAAAPGGDTDAFALLSQVHVECAEATMDLRELGGLDAAAEAIDRCFADFLPLWLSRQSTSMQVIMERIVEQFPIEPIKPGRIAASSAAGAAANVLCDLFRYYQRCAESSAEETVLVTLGRMLTLLCDGVALFVELSGRRLIAVEEADREAFEAAVQRARERDARDLMGPYEREIEYNRAVVRRRFTEHATLTSFRKSMDDFFKVEVLDDFGEKLKSVQPVPEGSVSGPGLGSGADHPLYKDLLGAHEATLGVIDRGLDARENEIAYIAFSAALSLPTRYCTWMRRSPQNQPTTLDMAMQQAQQIVQLTGQKCKDVLNEIIDFGDRATLAGRLSEAVIASLLAAGDSQVFRSAPLMLAPQPHLLRAQHAILNAMAHEIYTLVGNFCETCEVDADRDIPARAFHELKQGVEAATATNEQLLEVLRVDPGNARAGGTLQRRADDGDQGARNYVSHVSAMLMRQ